MPRGCTKDKAVQKSTGLTGTWELTISNGGFVGPVSYPKGNGTTLQFNADSTFAFYQQFKLANQGTYQVVKNGVTFAQQKFDALYYNHQFISAVQLHGDTMTIGIDYADGLSSVYLRQ